MKTLAAVRIALRALRVDRLRSAFAMLGIIIGVAAVIAVVAVGSGATARIQGPQDAADEIRRFPVEEGEEPVEV
jgi:hypothetical protein